MSHAISFSVLPGARAFQTAWSAFLSELYGFYDLLDLGIVFYYSEPLGKAFSCDNLCGKPGFEECFLYLFELLKGKEMCLHSQPFGLEIQKQVGQKLIRALWNKSQT